MAYPRTAWKSERPFEAWAFRARLERARAVARQYRLTERPCRGGWRRFLVVGPNAPYRVSLDLTGAACHRCSCPDGRIKVLAFAEGGSLCKHVLACALKGRAEHLIAPFLCLSRIARSTCAGLSPRP